MNRKNTKRTVVQTGLLGAFRLIGIQALVVVLVSLAWGLYGFNAMSSALLGGAVNIVPSAYFVYRFFASGCQSNPRKIVRAFYVGELLKLVIIVAFVIGIFMVVSVLILPFLTGLIGASLGWWSGFKVAAT